MKTLLLTAALGGLVAGMAQAETLRFPHGVGYAGSESLDPISPQRFYEMNQTLYSRLVRQDNDGMIVPDLATEWSASEDAKTWTFRLRDGVTFHNGNDFTAEDVVFSLERTKSEEIDSPVKAVLGIIDSVTAIDDHTVEIQLSSPHADFPILLMDYRVRMLDSETCNNDMTQVCEEGVGTGPFKMVSYDPVGTTVLERFDAYWEGPAKVENLEVIGIADQQAQVSALQAGQIDIMFSVTGQQRPIFERGDKFVVQSVPTGRWVGFAMRSDTAPFDDARVRKALRIATDRDAMGKLVFGAGNYTIACDTPVWSGDQYRSEIDCARDIDAAKALLEEAGYDGAPFELFVSDISEGAMRMAEVYQAQLAEAGIPVELVVAPSDGYWSDTWMQEPFVATSWSQRPADQILNEAYRGGAAWNETFQNMPEFDAMLDEAREKLDFDERKTVYGALQEKLFEEGGSFIPFHQNTTRVISSKLSGLPEVEDFTIRFQDIAKSE